MPPRCTRPTLLAATTLTATLALGACGTTEDAASTSTTSAGSAHVTVTDARGKEVTLDAPAERVVALEWAEVEMLATLGADLVGVADPAGYETWNASEPLPDDVQDVGLRQEASVDAIVALDPDLVVLEAERGSPLLKQLEEYVPVLVTEGSDAGRNLERMRSDFTMIATAVGKAEEAAEVLADLDATMADAQARIAEAGAADTPFAMADGWMEGSVVNIRMFGDGALFSDVAEELGLVNAWDGEVDEMWGLGTTDVEGVSALKDHEDLTFLYSASADPDPFAEGLAGNRLWESLPFVKQGEVHKLEDGTWTFGGPSSIAFFVEQLLDIYEA
jgi:ABC-type Fe3+-hydroxamate transport system substrate-binding protein